MNLVNKISRDLATALAQSIAENADDVVKDSCPDLVGVAALAWATAIQCQHLGISEEQAMYAFRKSYRQAQKLVAAGVPACVTVVDLTKASA